MRAPMENVYAHTRALPHTFLLIVYAFNEYVVYVMFVKSGFMSELVVCGREKPSVRRLRYFLLQPG